MGSGCGNGEWHIFAGKLGDAGDRAAVHSFCGDMYMSPMSQATSAAEVPMLSSQPPEVYAFPFPPLTSGDAGRTWTYLSHIPNDNPFDFSEPDIIETRDGRLLALLRTDWDQRPRGTQLGQVHFMRQTRQFGIRAIGTTTFVECQFHVTTTTTYLSCSLNQWNCTCPRLFLPRRQC